MIWVVVVVLWVVVFFCGWAVCLTNDPGAWLLLGIFGIGAALTTWRVIRPIEDQRGEDE